MTRIISLSTPMPAPHWALLERQLLDAQSTACREFFEKYYDERGYFKCVPRWSANDGADDAAENQLNWTMLHALGGADDILDMFKIGWDGHLRQYTEAKTTLVEMGKEGIYYKEFPVMSDWFHIGEGLSAFNLLGLSDPKDASYEARLRRFSGLYMNEDIQAPNYDPKHRIIRSMFNGSRGPLLRPATGID
ncbi:MAG: hypothetical protein O3A33_14350, partial [Chloroflexi bacterium]|nr:hypothetical protein [Chloroflexota bacterium]